jgi:hypothetical protein
MSSTWRETPDQRAELVLEDEPPYCRVLPSAPAEREPELNHGLWLVLAYAAWSGPDRRAIPIALSVAKDFRGEVQLGIREFSDHDEIRRWCPDVKEKWGSPVWLILKNGKLCKELMGYRDSVQLKHALEEVIAQNEQACV